MAASWLIGSHPNITATTVTVTANATQEVLTVTSAAQGCYLYNGGGSYDALALMTTALQSHSQITTATCVLRRDKKTSLTCDIAWVVDEWSDSTFQTLLGFAGEEEVSSATAQVSTQQSPYLWSPGFRESSEGRLGEIGAPYYDTAVGQSGNRVVVATVNNSGKSNKFTWRNVANDVVWTSAEGWDEYFSWWDYVQRRFYKFKLWRDVNENLSSTTAATLSDVIGPYVYRWNGRGPISFPYEREIEFMESLHQVELPVVYVDEYS